MEPGIPTPAGPLEAHRSTSKKPLHLPTEGGPNRIKYTPPHVRGSGFVGNPFRGAGSGSKG